MTNMRTLTKALNEVVGYEDEPVLTAAKAANIYAGTSGVALVGALNKCAGTTGIDLAGVLNRLAGTSGLPADAAASAWADQVKPSALLASEAVWSIDAEDGGSQWVPNRGTGGSALDASVGSAASRLTVESDHIYLPGVSGCYLTTPDAAALDITGDLDVRVRVACDDWTPAATCYLMSKRSLVSSQIAYYMKVLTSGVIVMGWSADGSTAIERQSTVATGLADGSVKWVRATLDVDNGSSGHDVKFWLSDDGVSWTQLGSTVTTAGTTSVAATTAQFEIGTYAGGTTGALPGKFYRVIIKSGIDGTTVLDVDCGGHTPDTRQFAATTDQTITVVEGGLYLPGIAGNALSVPTAGTTYPTGDTEFIAHVAATDWTPTTGTQYLIDSYAGVGGRVWTFSILNTTGVLRLAYSRDGSTVMNADSTVAPTVADGAALWLKATLDVDNGAGGTDVKFYTSTDGSTYSQLGSTVTNAGTGAIWGTMPAVVGIGARGSNLTDNPFSGKMYRAIVKNGIGGAAVLDIDCSVCTAVPGTGPAFTALTGQSVVVNRYAPLVTVNDSGADTNDPTWLPHDGTNYVWLPGVTNNTMTVPSAGTTWPTTDMDVRARVAMDWTPSVESELVNKLGGTRSWDFYITAGGILTLRWSADGSALITKQSTTPVGFTDYSTHWVRAVLDADNGATGYTVRFYTSDDTDGTTWTQLGADVVTTGSTTSIHQNTDALELGTRGSTGSFTGAFYRAQVISDPFGTPTTVLDVDTSVITSGSATSFTALSGQTVTIARATSGRKTVAVTHPVWLFGTDDYLSVVDDPSLDFGASDSFTVLAVVRRTGTLANFNTMMAKKVSVGTAAVTAGYAIRLNADGKAWAYYGDGTTGRVDVSSPAVVVNQTAVYTATFTPASSSTSANGTSGAAVTTAIGSLVNSEALRIGRLSGGSTEYSDMEFVAAAVWRGVRSAAETRALTTFFQNRWP